MSVHAERLQRLGLSPSTSGTIQHDDGSVTITEAQRRVHVTTEAIAVVAVAPFMFWLATRRELPEWSRWVSGGIGAATVIVDGGLLLKYVNAKKKAKP